MDDFNEDITDLDDDIEEEGQDYTEDYSEVIKRIDVADVMSKSYIDYSMSVIVSRALPDVRDGLKPVHRRLIFSSHELGINHRGPTVKSARITGDTMGKYHPHGDAASYGALVRLTQNWWLNLPLFVGQGNMGHRDGNPPAASRYTEAKLAPITEYMLHDLKEDTVEWRDNYDGTLKEPKVLPAKFPQILVNGHVGIAVGMATNFPPHNLNEVLDACEVVLKNPSATLDDVLKVMPGPDFPTGGKIFGLGGIRQAYETGNGSIRTSGTFEIVPVKNGKHQIIISELPYGVSAESIIDTVRELAKKPDGGGPAKFEGLADIWDASGKDKRKGAKSKFIPLRVIIELKRDIDPNIALNFLKKNTEIVTNFSANMVALEPNGRPKRMSLLEILTTFTRFRQQVVRRRTIYRLNAVRDLMVKQVGLYAAVSIVDEVVRAIRGSSGTPEARQKLLAMEIPITTAFRELLFEADPDEVYGDYFKFSPEQADYILELKLSSLTSMGLDKILSDVRDSSASVKAYLNIINNKHVIDGIVIDEWNEIKAKFGKPRQTVIEPYDIDNIDDDDLVESKDIVITVSEAGYMKRTLMEAYREQARGGRGRTGMETKDDDFVKMTLKCTTKTPLVIFSTNGKAFTLKPYKLPDSAPNAKGRFLTNFVPLEEGETVAAIIALPEDKAELEGKSLIFVTNTGYVRRNDISDFLDIKSNGKIAMDLSNESGGQAAELVTVLLAADDEDLMLTSAAGMSARFPIEGNLRVFNSRKSLGIRGMNLDAADRIISAAMLKHVEYTNEERDAYFAGGTLVKKLEDGSENVIALSKDRMAEMKESEQMLLTITENGYGKQTSAHEFRVSGRSVKGLASAVINTLTGKMVSCMPVLPDDGLILTTDGGQTIRTRVSEIRTSKRMTRGVIVFKLPKDQKIVGVVRVAREDELLTEPTEDAAS